MNRILERDLQHIWSGLHDDERGKLAGTSVLITGCAGFLGYTFVNFFLRFANELQIKRVIGLDTFHLGRPQWLDELAAEHGDRLVLQAFDIATDRIEELTGAAVQWVSVGTKRSQIIPVG